MKKHHYIIIGLLIILIFLQLCSGPGGGGISSGRDTLFIKSEKVYDSTRYYFPVLHPMPVDSFEKEIPAKVDTAAILKMFFTEKDYQDQFRDSNIVIDYKAKVYMNTLKNFVPSYQILRATEEKKIYLAEEHKVKVFGGPVVGLDRSGRFRAGPQVVIMDKKENLYTADLDLINQGLMVGKLWKIHFKKNNSK
jgi:hypothetical protein